MDIRRGQRSFYRSFLVVASGFATFQGAKVRLCVVRRRREQAYPIGEDWDLRDCC